MPPKTRKSAAPKAAAAAEPPSTPTVTVRHGFRRPRELPYRPTASVASLLAEAVRAHGLRFAANAHLRLHPVGDDRPYPLDQSAQAAGIQPGHTLELH